MSLLCPGLSVWEIGHRWAGVDPNVYRLRIPLAVRDNFRLLIGAIYQGELSCSTLMMEKWRESEGDDMKPFYIRHHLDSIWACIGGSSPDRKLMKWARVDRWALKEW